MLINIYSLSDPQTDSVFYIGATQHELHKRLNGHLYETIGNKAKVAIVRSIRDRGEKPKIDLLEAVELEDSTFAEQFYCDLFKSWGFSLCNKRKSQYLRYQMHKEYREHYIAVMDECRENGVKFNWDMVREFEPNNNDR